MPALSPTMNEGNIVSWKKKEGDFVKAGDQLAEIETDKATVSFDSTEEGYIAKILLPAGSKKVKVGTTIAILVEDKSQIGAFKDYVSPTAAASVPPSQSPPTSASTPPSPAAPPSAAAGSVPVSSAGRVIASPLAKKTAQELGIDLRTAPVTGTGPNQRIIKQDVLEYAQQRAATQPPLGPHLATASAAPTAPFTDIPVSQIRRVHLPRLLTFFHYLRIYWS